MFVINILVFKEKCSWKAIDCTTKSYLFFVCSKMNALNSSAFPFGYGKHNQNILLLSQFVHLKQKHINTKSYLFLHDDFNV